MRRYPFVRRPSAHDLVILAAVAVVLLPARALASSHIDDVTGLYRGFSLSDRDPRNHPFMELRVTDQNDMAFSGLVVMGAPDGAQAEFTGKITDRLGQFKGRALGAFFEVKFDGIIQSLGDRRGLLVLATYKNTLADGSVVDQGTTRLLRSFQPSDPVVPIITVDWIGTAMSNLTGEEMTAHANITGQDGTSFDGVLGVGPELFMIVGTIGSGEVSGPLRVVIIGADDGTVMQGGALIDPLDEDGFGFSGTFSLNYATRAVDLGTLMLRRSER